MTGTGTVVPEYWYVDLDADEIYVDRFKDGTFATTTFGRGSTLKSAVLPGFELPVDEVLGDA